MMMELTMIKNRIACNIHRVNQDIEEDDQGRNASVGHTFKRHVCGCMFV